jgi:biopolymer transport protein ExbD
MRHRLRLRTVPLTLLFLTITGAALPLRAEPSRQLRITVVAGDSCVVEGTAIPCADLLKHLREVVKLPAGSNVRVRVEPTTSYESTARVFELLQKSEYKTPVGYINVTDFPDR